MHCFCFWRYVILYPNAHPWRQRQPQPGQGGFPVLRWQGRQHSRLTGLFVLRRQTASSGGSSETKHYQDPGGKKRRAQGEEEDVEDKKRWGRSGNAVNKFRKKQGCAAFITLYISNDIQLYSKLIGWSNSCCVSCMFPYYPQSISDQFWFKLWSAITTIVCTVVVWHKSDNAHNFSLQRQWGWFFFFFFYK